MNISNHVIAILALVLAPLPGYAQSEIHDRFSISVGAFFTDWGTNVRLDSDTLGTGTDIDFENDLGLRSSSSIFRIDGHYRFNDRHRINFSVFDMSRDANRTIDRDIQFGDIIFAINTDLSASTDLSIYKLAYTYSFLRREKGYLGATFGLFVADSTFRLSERNLGRAETGGLSATIARHRNAGQLPTVGQIHVSWEWRVFRYRL